MRRLLLCAVTVIGVFGFASCDVEFLDLTTGEATLQEANGLNEDGPYLSVNNGSKIIQIGDIDDSGGSGTIGNNNRYLEPGETGRFAIAISNTGKKDANAVSIQVSSRDSNVISIQNADGYIPFIEHDDYISSYGPGIDDVLISINALTPHASKIRIDVDMSDGSGNSWHDYCLLLVY